MSEVAPILVFAVGNESRGDDALGPLLLRELQAWVEQTGRTDQIELIEEFQLQVEHTLDMLDRELVLFIDAATNLPGPFRFSRAYPKPFDSHTSHAVAPEALLGIHQQVHGQTAPPAYILAVKGESFELGAELSTMATENMKCACNFVKDRVLTNPHKIAWHDVLKNFPENEKLEAEVAR